MVLPRFRKDVNGRVILTDTVSACRVKSENRKWAKPESYSDVKSSACRNCKLAGGDETVPREWMGFLRMQWGQYRGETFRWMLENTPGYCGWLANKLSNEKLYSEDENFMIKMTFKKYLSMFPEGVEILEVKKKKNKPAADSSSKCTSNQTTSLGEELLDEMDSTIDEELVACLDIFEGSSKASGETVEVVTEVQTDPTGPTRIPFTEQTEQQETEQQSLLQRMSSDQQPHAEEEDFLFIKKWKKTVPEIDQKWISRAFFIEGTRADRCGQFDFNRVTKLWYDPPQPSLSRGVLNKQECFFGHRLFFWMPRHLFSYQFLCPQPGCEGTMVNAGVNQKTRMVLDIHDYYIIIGEVYACNAKTCKKTVVSWSDQVLDQLDRAERSKFPCILTSRYACDMKVVRMMRQRTLGNSSSLVCKQVAENHGETYLDKCRQYATSYLAFKKSAARGLVTIPQFVEPPLVKDIPRHRWFMKVYQLDVLSRLPYMLAEMTSITGDILKIDSTKKVTNKLGGVVRGTANWATNVGNEHGQVLMSVLTVGEGESNRKMLNGIITRYRTAGVPPPKILYTDRDCCGRQCVKKYFDAWPFLHVKLDIWHFMRRFPNGCTTDKHQLYGPFMARLSRCIFKIDEEDYDRLKRAKRQELHLQGIQNPSDDDVTKHITADEVGRHCKRATRGINVTSSLITELIASLDGDKGLDISGVPLINSVKMAEIWDKQSIHVGCLQDPPGVRLYQQVSTMKKGGVDLPVYKCARGSTSLESFHLHLARFIPGSLASDTNFQVYLLDGIFRWNADRAAEAVSTGNLQAVVPRTYSGSLKNETNLLWEELCGRPFFPDFRKPAKYTGELVGVQYLYDQTGQMLPDITETRVELTNDDETEPNITEDEGFSEMATPGITPPEDMVPLPESVQDSSTSVELPSHHRRLQPILHIPSEEEYQQMAMESNQDLEPPMVSTTPASVDQVTVSTNREIPSLEESKDADESIDVMGPDNINEYDKVMSLAEYLVTLRTKEVLTSVHAQQIICLWDQLSHFDQKRSKYPKKFTTKPWSGKFGGRGKVVEPGVESITKARLSPNRGPASKPDCNRYMEAIFVLLFKVFPGDERRDGRTVTKWNLVTSAYHNIQQLVVKCPQVMKHTEIILAPINQQTLRNWYNKEGKDQQQQILLQGVDMPKPALTGRDLPQARQKPAELISSRAPTFEFKNPLCTARPSRPNRTRKLQEMRSVPYILPRPEIRPPVPSYIPPIPTTPVLRFPVVLSSFSDTSTVSSSTTSATTSKHNKKPKFAKCSKCGENRNDSETHKSYMFYIYCVKTESISFEQWRQESKLKADKKRQSKKKRK